MKQITEASNTVRQRLVAGLQFAAQSRDDRHAGVESVPMNSSALFSDKSQHTAKTSSLKDSRRLPGADKLQHFYALLG